MKLVRDRIPELAAANGHPGAFHQADEAEFGRWLRAKLLEEAQEAATAAPAGLLEELGDSLGDENLRAPDEESLFAKVKRAFGA